MTSASTLIRMAAKAKTKAEAKRLRAQAAELRRKARQNAKGYRAEAKSMLAEATTAIGADPAANRSGLTGSQMLGPFPDPMAERAESLLKLARHKATTVDTIRHELSRIANNATYEADRKARDSFNDVLKANNAQHAVNVVCAFVAAAEGWARANGGPMPATAVIAGHTLARVVDALKQAGYSADGLKSMSRFAADQRMTR